MKKNSNGATSGRGGLIPGNGYPSDTSPHRGGMGSNDAWSEVRGDHPVTGPVQKPSFKGTAGAIETKTAI